MIKTYLSNFASRHLSRPAQYIPLVNGTTEKRMLPPIAFRGGVFKTNDPEVQAFIEAQADFSPDKDFGQISEEGRPVTIKLLNKNPAEAKDLEAPAPKVVSTNGKAPARKRAVKKAS